MYVCKENEENVKEKKSNCRVRVEYFSWDNVLLLVLSLSFLSFPSLLLLPLPLITPLLLIPPASPPTSPFLLPPLP